MRGFLIITKFSLIYFSSFQPHNLDRDGVGIAMCASPRSGNYQEMVAEATEQVPDLASKWMGKGIGKSSPRGPF